MNSILSNLPKIVDKGKKRLGRGLGSGRGAKSGRGTSRHQKSRENIPLHFEGGQGRIVKKFPLLRGKGINKPQHKDTRVISLSNLNVFNAGDTIDIKSLIQRGIIKENKQKQPIKVLGSGKLEKKLHVKLEVSLSAKREIEKLGGTVLS